MPTHWLDRSKPQSKRIENISASPLALQGRRVKHAAESVVATFESLLLYLVARVFLYLRNP